MVSFHAVFGYHVTYIKIHQVFKVAFRLLILICFNWYVFYYYIIHNYIFCMPRYMILPTYIIYCYSCISDLNLQECPTGSTSLGSTATPMFQTIPTLERRRRRREGRATLHPPVEGLDQCIGLQGHAAGEDSMQGWIITLIAWAESELF